MSDENVNQAEEGAVQAAGTEQTASPGQAVAPEQAQVMSDNYS